MQYEDWEFELEMIKDRFQGCDSYKYEGTELNKFLNKHSDETELLFTLEILEAVILTFKDKSPQFYKNIQLIITRTNKLKSNLCIDEYTKYNVQISYFYKRNNVYIIYARNSLIKDLLNSIR
ncbi:hypothetical protein [Flavobacterium sp.]|uniref:hypothetical protein n=1 Tax=Flavobacterium sp. TaxID=239 RepID=UPI002D7F9203|nr:hypothetical protein [Flavobacterium sp.]